MLHEPTRSGSASELESVYIYIRNSSLGVTVYSRYLCLPICLPLIRRLSVDNMPSSVGKDLVVHICISSREMHLDTRQPEGDQEVRVGVEAEIYIHVDRYVLNGEVLILPYAIADQQEADTYAKSEQVGHGLVAQLSREMHATLLRSVSQSSAS